MRKYKYSYYLDDDNQTEIGTQSGYGWIDSNSSGNIHFHNQYRRKFVLVDLVKARWFCVALAVFWYLIGRMGVGI